MKKVNFFVAECMEFKSLGEYWVQIPSFEEAVRIMNRIPPERMNGGRGIGIITDEGFEIPIYDNGNIDEEFINSFPEASEEYVQEAVRKAKKMFK